MECFAGHFLKGRRPSLRPSGQNLYQNADYCCFLRFRGAFESFFGTTKRLQSRPGVPRQQLLLPTSAIHRVSRLKGMTYLKYLILNRLSSFLNALIRQFTHSSRPQRASAAPVSFAH